MKKLLVIAAALSISAGAANAQDAFKHLSVGLEIGTTGAGVELALPVVTDHLVLKAGYNFPNANLNVSTNLNISEFSSDINDFVNDANDILADLGETDRLLTLPNTTKVDVNGSVNLGSFKAMLEYYPSKKSSFHITAGVYVGGKDNLISAGCDFSEVWNVYQADVAVANKYASELEDAGAGSIPDPKFSLNGKSYQLKNSVDAGIKIAKARPYLGIGFGRSIPETHFGFQFDLGVWYHGKPEISSSNEIKYDASYVDFDLDLSKMEKICVYPQLSFRLIYRIF